MIGGHFIKGWARTPNHVTLSSAEAELIALVKGCCEALGVESLIRDLGGSTSRIVARTDASAAVGIAKREGVGRTRHLETGVLWIQQKEWETRIVVQRVAGRENPADIMTKNVQSDILWRHMRALGFQRMGGRADKAVEVVE